MKGKTLEKNLDKLRELEKNNHQEMMMLNENHRIIREKTISLIHKYIIKKSDFLDIGCAEGFYNGYVKTMLHINSTGIDNAPKKIKKAKLFYPLCSFKVGDSCKLPLKSNKYDFILCSETLQHLLNYEKGIKEIKRVSKTNGITIITVPNNSNHGSYKVDLTNIKSLKQLDNLIGGAGRGEINGIWQFDSRDLIKKFESFGFEVLEVCPIGVNTYISSLNSLIDEYRFLRKLIGSLLNKHNGLFMIYVLKLKGKGAV